MRAVLVAALLGWAAPAWCHDSWSNGDPIPSWVRSQCCGVADAHRLEPDQVHQVDGGFRVDGYPDLIPVNKALPSQDAHWWVFYRQYPDGSFSSVYCFFEPMSF